MSCVYVVSKPVPHTAGVAILGICASLEVATASCRETWGAAGCEVRETKSSWVVFKPDTGELRCQIKRVEVEDVVTRFFVRMWQKIGA